MRCSATHGWCHCCKFPIKTGIIESYRCRRARPKILLRRPDCCGRHTTTNQFEWSRCPSPFIDKHDIKKHKRRPSTSLSHLSVAKLSGPTYTRLCLGHPAVRSRFRSRDRSARPARKSGYGQDSPERSRRHLGTLRFIFMLYDKHVSVVGGGSSSVRNQHLRSNSVAVSRNELDSGRFTPGRGQ